MSQPRLGTSYMSALLSYLYKCLGNRTTSGTRLTSLLSTPHERTDQEALSRHFPWIQPTWKPQTAFYFFTTGIRGIRNTIAPLNYLFNLPGWTHIARLHCLPSLAVSCLGLPVLAPTCFASSCMGSVDSGHVYSFPGDSFQLIYSTCMVIFIVAWINLFLYYWSFERVRRSHFMNKG